MTGALAIGFLQGLAIALFGFAIVLVYRAERFVNFASVQLGVVPALLLAKLCIDVDLSWYIAFPLVVILGAAIGIATRTLLIARLDHATRTGATIATLGLSQLLLGMSFFRWMGPSGVSLGEEGYPSPIHGQWRLASATITGRDVLIGAVVPIVLGGVTVWLRRSTFGRTIRAVASNEPAARLAGIDIGRTKVGLWAIVGALCGIGAVLTAPGYSVVELQVSNPVFLFASFGAAALAGFTSLGVAIAAGITIGVVGGVVSFTASSSGAGIAAGFAFVLAGLIVRSRLAPGATESIQVEQSDPPLIIPPALVGRWFLRPWTIPAVFSAIAVALPFLPWLSAPHRTLMLASTATMAVVTLSLTLLSGWTGELSLGQFAFVGLGAFVAARLAPHGWSLLATMLAAATLSAAAAAVVGLPALRARHLSLAVSSLGLAVAAEAWIFLQGWLAPTSTATAPAAFSFGFGRLVTQRSVYLVAVAVLVAVGTALARLRRSHAGRALVAVRDNERGAASFGYSPVAVRVGAFAASGAVAGIAGVLWLAVNRNVSATSFDSSYSLLVVSAAVVGGLQYVRGAVIGAIVVFGIPLPFDAVFDNLFDNSYQATLLLGGLALVLTQVFNPAGIAAARRAGLQHLLDRLAARAGQPRDDPPAAAARGVAARAMHWTPTPTPTPARAGAAPLRVTNLRVHFGGVAALNGVSLRVSPGEIVGVIGANGSGKTTLLNAVSGLVSASGSVEVFGADMRGVSPARRARAGVSRGFQDARLFATLSVTDTIELALARRRPPGVFGAIVGAPWTRLAEASIAQEADEIIGRFGLRAYATTPVDRLSTGVRHICEIAALVALRPHLLVLDEPTSGVAQRETEAFVPLIRGVADDQGCAIVLVEHDMGVLLGVADRVYCLDRGGVIAEGTPAQIRTNPEVIARYLGTSAPARRTRRNKAGASR